MLKELQIRNFALIEELELSFYSGFSVLTGETGAGKSIIIDALGLLLGARASVEMIRTGAETTEVSGSFTLTPPARVLIEAWGMGEGEELIIARELNLNGRNKCWINGRMATVSQLSELGVHLVDIVGQHDSQSLLDPQEHGGLLDAYGGEEHLVLLKEVRDLANKWSALQGEQSRLQRDERERNRRIDLLTFQVEEITKAQLEPEEDERLKVERSRLANLDRIRQSLHFVLMTLGESFEEQESLLRRLALTEAELEKATTLDPTLQPLTERYTELALNLNDLHGELRDYLEALPGDPELLQTIEERLELIDNLQRKYGETVAEILQYGEEAKQELEDLENALVRVDHLEKQSKELQESWLHKAELLSLSRQKLARELERQIEGQLGDLSMGNTKFKVEFSKRSSDTPNPNGLEELEFMMAPNLGEELKPLAKIASGGELSRVMLAIKAILVETEHVPTIIFDEIDAGIGGRTAVSLGEKLFSLSGVRQVLCVTHLPVIASYGTNHYSVRKSTGKERTTVTVTKLGTDERVEELTRMLGGTTEDAVTLEHARELLRKPRPDLPQSGI